MEFGQKLKEARLKAGLTQEDIVRQIGVSRQTVSNWENDRSYPDLGSVLKLSELYGMSLDDLLKEDASLQRRMAEKKERLKRYSFYLHDLAMLLIGSTILLAWLGETTAGLILGTLGIALICVVHVLFILKLGTDRKNTMLRCLAMVLWFTGFMLQVLSGYISPLGELLWLAGLALHWYGSSKMGWDVFYPRHMTAFTGFVLALVLVFGAVPLIGDTVTSGKHIEDNPFNSREYRVAEVIQGDRETLPTVYLGSSNSVWIDFPGEENQILDGEFLFIPQPEGSHRKGVWEMIPEDATDSLYRVTLEVDDSVTIACYENEQVIWEYLLELSPTAGCTILDVLGTVAGEVKWYENGTFDPEQVTGGLPLRGKGTVKLSIPGDGATVTIYEEFRDGDTVEHNTMTLTRDARGYVTFERKVEDTGRKQMGIYRIPWEDGEFVLVLNFIP